MTFEDDRKSVISASRIQYNGSVPRSRGDSPRRALTNSAAVSACPLEIFLPPPWREVAPDPFAGANERAVDEVEGGAAAQAGLVPAAHGCSGRHRPGCTGLLAPTQPVTRRS